MMIEVVDVTKRYGLGLVRKYFIVDEIGIVSILFPHPKSFGPQRGSWVD